MEHFIINAVLAAVIGFLFIRVYQISERITKLETDKKHYSDDLTEIKDALKKICADITELKIISATKT